MSILVLQLPSIPPATRQHFGRSIAIESCCKSFLHNATEGTSVVFLQASSLFSRSALW
ncbi:MAG: hypothetical protein WBB29_19145 [Geitlerinemataceae cyanobacterium]